MSLRLRYNDRARGWEWEYRWPGGGQSAGGWFGSLEAAWEDYQRWVDAVNRWPGPVGAYFGPLGGKRHGSPSHSSGHSSAG